MNFLALAVSILSLYAPVSEYAKNSDCINVLQQAALMEAEDEIMTCVERETHCRLNGKFKSELRKFLVEHGVNNTYNRKLLEIFLTNKVLDDMVDMTVAMYSPVFYLASQYEELSRGDRNRLICLENKIITRLNVRYSFSMDIDDRGDFVALIRQHGNDSVTNRKLLRQFFSGTKTKIFDKIAKFIAGSDNSYAVENLRRSLQSNLGLSVSGLQRGKTKSQGPCHNLAIYRQRGIRGGKNF